MMRLNFCPYTAVLIIIFSLFFLHTVFILNEDHTLIAAYELGDAGNLLYGVMSLFDYPIYSQQNYFFSSGYGWPLHDISFLVVLLLKVFGHLLGLYQQPIFGLVDDQPLFNGAIRAINFAFALATIWLFFKITYLLFENKKVSLVASLFLMFLPWAAVYSYWLHPDASGMFFLLVAIWYLLKFIKQEPKLIYFYIAFVSLVLTTLSKPYHGFYIFPIFLVFLITYCNKSHTNYLNFIFSKDFIKVLISLPLLLFLIILIIHPYSILDFKGGIHGNWLYTPWTPVTSRISNPNITPFLETFRHWLTFYQQEPIIVINFVLLYLLIIPLLYRKITLSILLVISVIFCNFYLFIVPFGRSMLDMRYIYPIAPLLILNIVAVVLYIWHKLGDLPFKSSYYLKILFAGLGMVYVLPVFGENVLVITNSLLARAAYQHSTIYQAREFMLTHPDTFSQRKILVDIGTAPVPPKNMWVIPHASVSWVPAERYILKERYQEYINPNLLIIWVPWESQAHSLEFINGTNQQFLILGEWRYNMYRDYLKKHRFEPMKKFQANNTDLASLTSWFPYLGNTQLNSFKTTRKLIEVHRNPNLIIGPTMVFYSK